MSFTCYTYRFRLYPNRDQKNRLARHFGICRFVYNYFLDRRNRLYEESKQWSSYREDCIELTKLKKGLDWVGEANSQSLQQELKNLDTAFNRFFKKQAKLPKFHSKKTDKQSFRVPQFVSVKDGNLHFPKFREGIKVKLHREIEGEIKYATVSMNRAGQYFVSVCVEKNIEPLPKVEKEVGVDLGVKALVTCSDGQVFENIKPYRTLENRLKHLHRALSRKTNGSKSKERARRRLSKLYVRIANIRINHLHKVSHRITSENQAIFIEDLNVSGMTKNSRLSKSIQDASMHELVRQISYKALWRGRMVVKIGRFYPSSKMCSSCGFINQLLTLSDRSWICPRCQVKHDRDLNAATNILMEGKRTVGITGLAGGEKRQPSVKEQFSVKPEAVSLRARASGC